LPASAVKRVVNEPTAAALAYGFGRFTGKVNIWCSTSAAGTFDVSILDKYEG